MGYGLKPHESLPVGRRREKLVALRFNLRRVHYAVIKLGSGLQRTPVQESSTV